MTSSNSTSKRFTVTYNGESLEATESTMWEVGQQLLDKHGPDKMGASVGIPAFTPVTSTIPAPVVVPAPALIPASDPTAKPVAVIEPVRPQPVRGETVDIMGALRSSMDFDAASKAGFAPQQTLYTRGTMVLDLGVENARRARQEYDEKPLVTEYCEELVSQVKSETRQDMTVYAKDVRMDQSGRVVLLDDAGAPGQRLLLPERAFGRLLYGLDIEGGSAYLAGCKPRLRAMNINEHAKDLGVREAASMDALRQQYQRELAVWQRRPFGRRGTKPEAPDFKQICLRTRASAVEGQRETFAVVSPKYTAFDVDQIAQAIQQATPGDARGTVAYDGYRMRAEVLFHTTVQPEHFVAGEFFRAGVIITSDDTGGGAIKVSACVWQNLCLNLLIIDQSEKETFRARHVGSVERLANDFRVGFRQALGKIEHFRRAWDYACEEQLAESVVAVNGEKLPTVRELLIAGTINGIIQQELVPVRGRKEEAVKAVYAAWQKDDSGAGSTHDGLNRAAVVNAFTRAAHETFAAQDPWIEDEIQAAAGQLLYPKGKAKELAPLPYMEWDGQL